MVSENEINGHIKLFNESINKAEIEQEKLSKKKEKADIKEHAWLFSRFQYEQGKIDAFGISCSALKSIFEEEYPNLKPCVISKGIDFLE